MQAVFWERLGRSCEVGWLEASKRPTFGDGDTTTGERFVHAVTVYGNTAGVDGCSVALPLDIDDNARRHGHDSLCQRLWSRQWPRGSPIGKDDERERSCFRRGHSFSCTVSSNNFIIQPSGDEYHTRTRLLQYTCCLGDLHQELIAPDGASQAQVGIAFARTVCSHHRHFSDVLYPANPLHYCFIALHLRLRSRASSLSLV